MSIFLDYLCVNCMYFWGDMIELNFGKMDLYIHEPSSPWDVVSKI
jgi:hypothetical protein